MGMKWVGNSITIKNLEERQNEHFPTDVGI
jgi:hypothetical protein